MDDEQLLRLIRGVVKEAVEEALGCRPYRLTQQAIEQRRAAGKARAAQRVSQRNQAADPLKKKPKKTSKTQRNQVAESNEINGADHPKLSTGSSHEPPGVAIWQSYSVAFKLKYGEFPARNAKVNGQLAMFAKRIPVPDAPGVAEYYLSLDEPLYAKGLHPVALLLRDAEKLHTLWKTKAKVVNGNDRMAAAKPWWETWSGIEKMGGKLAVAANENPTIYRTEVLRMAALCGELPEPICLKLQIPTS